MPVIEAGHGSKAVILGLHGAVRLLHFAAAPRYPALVAQGTARRTRRPGLRPVSRAPMQTV